MKKYLIVAALMMVSTMIFAQSKTGNGKKMGSGRADRMKKELALSDDQYSKINAIDKKYAEDRDKMHKDTAVSVGTARTQMKTLSKEHEAEIKSVLTKEQWDKWTALKEQKHDAKKKGHGDGKKEHDKKKE